MALMANKIAKMVQNKKNKKGGKPKKRANMGQGLSDCANKYKVAISDPWSPNSDGACIPRHPARPSQKIRLFSRNAITTSGAGTLFIFFTPSLSSTSLSAITVFVPTASNPTFPLINEYNANSLSAPASMTASWSGNVLTVTAISGYAGSGLKVTLGSLVGYILSQTSGTAGSTGTYLMDTSGTAASGSATLSAADATALTVQKLFCNSPYSTTQFGVVNGESQVSGRMVSFGASIQYTGTVVDMGGTYYMYVSPNHNNLNIPNLLNTLGSSTETLVDRITAKKQWLTVSSIEENELEYVEATDVPTGYSANVNHFMVYPYSNRTSIYQGSSIGCSPAAIACAVPKAASFELEFVAHVEYIGRSAQTAITPTHSDARGFEIVSQASAMIPQLRTAAPNSPLPTLMNKAVSMTMDALIPVAASAAQRLAVYGIRGAAARLGMGPAFGALRLT